MDSRYLLALRSAVNVLKRYAIHRARRRGLALDADWEESKHPRAENGQFGHGGGQAKQSVGPAEHAVAMLAHGEEWSPASANSVLGGAVRINNGIRWAEYDKQGHRLGQGMGEMVRPSLEELERWDKAAPRFAAELNRKNQPLFTRTPTSRDFARVYQLPGGSAYAVSKLKVSRSADDDAHFGGPSVRVTGEITTSDRKKIGRIERVFYRDSQSGALCVEHELLDIDPAHQGEGIATALNANAEAEYQRMGVSAITLTADITVGRYAWAREGYDFADPKDASRYQKRLLEAVADTIPVSTREWRESRMDYRDLKRQKARQLIEGAAGGAMPKHAWEIAALTIPGLDEDVDLSFTDVTGRTSTVKGTYPIGKAIMLNYGAWKGVKSLDAQSPGYRIGEDYKKIVKSKAKVRP